MRKMEGKSINARIVELFNEGKTTSEIRKEVNKSYQRVYNTLLVKGLTPKGSGREVGEKKKKIIDGLERGLSIMSICKEVDTWPGYVCKVKKEWKEENRVTPTEAPTEAPKEEDTPTEVKEEGE